MIKIRSSAPAEITSIISRHFQVIADYWSNLRFRQGVPLFDILVRGELLNPGS